jgi:hypothetical protein
MLFVTLRVQVRARVHQVLRAHAVQLQHQLLDLAVRGFVHAANEPVLRALSLLALVIGHFQHAAEEHHALLIALRLAPFETGERGDHGGVREIHFDRRLGVELREEVGEPYHPLAHVRLVAARTLIEYLYSDI